MWRNPKCTPSPRDIKKIKIIIYMFQKMIQNILGIDNIEIYHKKNFNPKFVILWDKQKRQIRKNFKF